MRLKFIIRIIIFLTTMGYAAQADWSQFLGPDRNGISSETSLARSWPESGPPELWTVEVGPGFGGAAILADKVYFLDRIDDEFDILRCLDFNNGRELWRQSYPQSGRTAYNGSRTVPTLDDRHIYVAGPFGKIYCLDQQTQKKLWQLDIAHAFDIQIDQMGYVCNPLLYGDTLIVATLSDKVGLVALNKTTGQIVWKSESLGTQSYVSPVLTRLCDQEMILYVSRYQVSGVDPQNGRLLWAYKDFECEATIPFPTTIDPHKIFITGGYDNVGSIMAQINREQNQYQVKELFRIKIGSQIHPVIFYKGYLYGNFNNNANLGKRKTQGLVCLDLQGNILWQTQSTVPIDRGNFIIADDMIYVLGGKSGVLTLLDVNPHQFRKLAEAKVLNDKKEMFAPLALSNGRLILRDHHEMKCLDVRQRQTP